MIYFYLCNDNERRVSDSPFMLETNVDGMIIAFDELLPHLTGYSHQELYHTNVESLRHPDMPYELCNAKYLQLDKCPRHWKGVVKYRCKGNDYFWAKTIITPKLSMTKSNHFVYVLSQASEREIELSTRLLRLLKSTEV